MLNQFNNKIDGFFRLRSFIKVARIINEHHREAFLGEKNVQ
ncbi:hypothetical protein VRK_32670 [Vibrio sp. MEBiC08052]|nr:hypothetical protein VRK_32670 [Vibrio sp. MEBiC08052]